MWGLVLAPLCSPFPQSTAFLSPFLLALGSCQSRAAECRGKQEQSLNFVPFPWHREGRQAAALLIGINTVTSHLLLPNEETEGAADLSFLLVKDLKVQLKPVFNISFSANPGTVILILNIIINPVLLRSALSHALQLRLSLTEKTNTGGIP